MLHMSSYRAMKGIFCAFLKIMTATTVHVHGYETGDDVHPLGINHFGPDNSQVTICHFQNLPVANQYGAVLQPSLRGKNLAIYYLCQHVILRFSLKQFIRSFH